MISMNSLSSVMVFSGVISLILSAYIYRCRRNPAMFNLLMILVAAGVWALACGFELSVMSLRYMKVSTAIAYLGIAATPVFWMIFVARYSGNDGWLTPGRTALLFVVPVISVVLVATNDMHHFFYSAYEMGRRGDLTFPETQAGPFWFIHVAYSYGLILAGLTFLLRMYFKVNPVNRFPVGMFIVASLLPYITNIAYVSGFKPFGFLDITPMAFIAMAVILIYGETTRKAMDVTPLAYDLLFHNLPDAIFVVDTQDRIADINPAAQNLLNSGLVNPQNLSAFGDGREFELEEKAYTVSNTRVRSPGGKILGYLIIFHDITVRKRHEQQLEYLSFRDQLTGLYNRRYFDNELLRLTGSRDYPISIICADLDGLKQINDTLGHAEGDRYIKAGAELLKTTLRTYDILARMGGDEFAILLPRTGREDAESFISRLRRKMKACDKGQADLCIGISLGSGVSDGKDITLEQAYKMADDEMYQDKINRKSVR